LRKALSYKKGKEISNNRKEENEAKGNLCTKRKKKISRNRERGSY
jgi:hypothetical protein